jgi:hypothetical protein
MTSPAACRHTDDNAANGLAGGADPRLHCIDGRRNSGNGTAVTARETFETLLRARVRPIRVITAALRPPTGACPVAKSP